jgi:hypothetical protein
MRKTIKIIILSLFILSCKTQYSTSFDGIEAERFNNKKTNSQSLKSDFKIATGEISKEFVLNKSNLLLLNGMIAVTDGYFSLSIVNTNGDEWLITNKQDQTIEFRNEIVELPNKGNYKINISLINASGYYDFKWKEASDNLKNSNQNYSRKLIEKNMFDKVRNIKDSIKVGNMIIQNAFKYQILAHQNSKFDSLMILKKVYLPNKYTFDNCLGLIFGEENGKKFKPNGFFKWNKKLLHSHKELIASKLAVLDTVNINELFKNHLNAVQELTGQKGNGNWIIYFGPKDFQIFGGCDRNSMILDMFGDAWNSKSINDLFAHEIEHLIFEPIAEKDTYGNSGLGITLDEGLAVYFTYIYLKQDANQALYGNNTKILFDKEKEIFKKLEPFLYKTEEEGCPIYRHCGRSNMCEPIIKDIPENIQDELCYFLGFRIIQKYVEKHGKNSWKDLYTIPFKEFYENSGYKEYIELKQ